MLCPLVFGRGRRLFGEAPDMTALRMTDRRTTNCGVVVLTYEPA
jgi:hypothetical protein